MRVCLQTTALRNVIHLSDIYPRDVDLDLLLFGFLQKNLNGVCARRIPQPSQQGKAVLRSCGTGHMLNQGPRSQSTSVTQRRSRLRPGFSLLELRAARFSASGLRLCVAGAFCRIDRDSFCGTPGRSVGARGAGSTRSGLRDGPIARSRMRLLEDGTSDGRFRACSRPSALCTLGDGARVSLVALD